jgi:hypothetical protein
MMSGSPHGQALAAGPAAAPAALPPSCPSPSAKRATAWPAPADPHGVRRDGLAAGLPFRVSGRGRVFVEILNEGLIRVDVSDELPMSGGGPAVRARKGISRGPLDRGSPAERRTR